jgi:hypothetical protein
VSSHQQGEMTEKDQRCLLIIGGIEVFLPHSPFEARESVEDDVVGEGQLVVTFIEREELDKVLISSPVEEEHVDKILTPWEEELGMLEDWLKNLEPVDDYHEQTVMQIAGEKHSKKLLKSFNQEYE